MNITSLTLKSAELFLALLPTETEKLNSAIHFISNELNIYPPDCIALIRRCGSPKSAPTFDGTHEEADWYNNNLQIPRLLVALTDHLGIHDTIPNYYSVDPRLIDILDQSRIFIDAYVKRERNRLGIK